MDVSNYRKAALATFDPKIVKAGLRGVASNKQGVILAAAILGLKNETGQLMQAVSKFVLGEQIKPELRDAAANELGDILRYAVIGAKAIKVKVPGSGKKIKPKQTMTESILRLDALTTNLLAHLDHAFDGSGLGAPSVTVQLSADELAAAQAKAAAKGKESKRTTKKVDHETRTTALADISTEWAELIQTVYSLCWTLCQKTPGEVMDASVAKLRELHPGLIPEALPAGGEAEESPSEA